MYFTFLPSFFTYLLLMELSLILQPDNLLTGVCFLVLYITSNVEIGWEVVGIVFMSNPPTGIESLTAFSTLLQTFLSTSYFSQLFMLLVLHNTLSSKQS